MFVSSSRLPDGTTILLEARVDGTTDMLGMFTDAAERVPFTAAYRPKENWLENINAQPGGIGGSPAVPARRSKVRSSRVPVRLRTHLSM